MSKELERELDRDVDYWGGCPECHQNDGFLNAHRRDHYFVCHEHKARWYIGSNLFSAWRETDDEELDSQHTILDGYKAVEPWYPDDDVAKPLLFLRDLYRRFNRLRARLIYQLRFATGNVKGI